VKYSRIARSGRKTLQPIPTRFFLVYLKYNFGLFKTQITWIYADLRIKSNALRLTSGLMPKISP